MIPSLAVCLAGAPGEDGSLAINSCASSDVAHSQAQPFTVRRQGVMAQSLELLCPAKVNLHLRIVGRRPDGYHDLITLMQPIGLFDEISLTVGGRGIRLLCDSRAVPSGEDNLVFRAARLFQEETRDHFGLEIHLRKRIPVAAGLGGGSSDAAGVLCGLNRLRGAKVPEELMSRWAVSLGADVPFFLLGGPALGTGIGERLERVKILPEFWYLLLSPGWPVSTKWAYENLGPGLTKQGKGIKIPHLIAEAEEIIQLLHNDLESVTARQHGWIPRAKVRLKGLGAAGVLMSGSGPTVFGLFLEEAAAREAMACLVMEEGESVWLAKGLS